MRGTLSHGSQRGAASVKVIGVVAALGLLTVGGLAAPGFLARRQAPAAVPAADQARQDKEQALRADLAALRNAEYKFFTDTNYFPLCLADLAAPTSAQLSTPNTVRTGQGGQSVIAPKCFHGPYLASLPIDPVSGESFRYSVAAGSTGCITSSATGQATDGTNYGDW